MLVFIEQFKSILTQTQNQLESKRLDFRLKYGNGSAPEHEFMREYSTRATIIALSNVESSLKQNIESFQFYQEK